MVGKGKTVFSVILFFEVSALGKLDDGNWSGGESEILSTRGGWLQFDCNGIGCTGL